MLYLIAAMSEAGVIGHQGALPWQLPDDLLRFKRLTHACPLIMGRRTFDSLPGILPGRKHIVLTRDNQWQHPGVEVAHYFDKLCATLPKDQLHWVIGGSEIYAQAFMHVQRLYLTIVHAQVVGDCFFPTWDLSQWECVETTMHQADERHAHAFTFKDYRRKETV